MRKLLAFVLIVACLSSIGYAQDTAFASPLPHKEAKNTFKYWIGIRGGLNFAQADYTYSGYDCYSHQFGFAPVAGIFAQFQLGRYFSLRPEFSYVERGDSLTWLDVGYRIKTQQFDFRLPLTFNFRFHSTSFSPYLMVAPMLSIPFRGTISYHDDTFPQGVSVSLNDTNMGNLDFGLLLGAGMEWDIPVGKRAVRLSLEGGYQLGLLNTFSKPELQGNAIVANPFFGVDRNQGSRYWRGWEGAVRIAIPLDKKRHTRLVSSATHQIDTVNKTDTVYLKGDTLLLEKVMQVNSVDQYVHKDCYSFAEMYSFITLGMDISDKRICMHINFDFGSYTIRENDLFQLDDVVMMMKVYPQMVIVVSGHTDSIGSPAYNQTLSENRANSVVEYLEKNGIDRKRVLAIGYGPTQPIDSNKTATGRFNNRRVEFDIFKIGPRRK